MGLTFSKAFVERTKKDGKLNNNSVIRYQAMLSSIFKKGVQWGLINENPCSRAEHPKAEEIDVRVLTEEEIPKLLDALSDAPPQYSVITQLALLLGARRGEICALRWSDVDFEKGTLSIKRTVHPRDRPCVQHTENQTRQEMPAHWSGLRGTAAGVPAIPESGEVPDWFSAGAQDHTGKWQSGGQ